MKITLTLSILALSFCWASCNSNTGQKADSSNNALPKLAVWHVPPAGTEVAQFSRKIEQDKLNDGVFEVKIYTMEATPTEGEFEVAYAYGASGNSTIKVFPKWYEGNIVKPVIRTVDSLDYAALIGFDPGDGSFKDLYLIQYKDEKIRLRRTKHYSTSGNNTK